jgi:hypothetical protein
MFAVEINLKKRIMKNKMYLCNKSYLDFTKGKVDEKLNKDSKEYIFIDDEGDETWINMSKSNFTLIELLNTLTPILLSLIPISVVFKAKEIVLQRLKLMLLRKLWSINLRI